MGKCGSCVYDYCKHILLRVVPRIRSTGRSTGSSQGISLKETASACWWCHPHASWPSRSRCQGWEGVELVCRCQLRWFLMVSHPFSLKNTPKMIIQWFWALQRRSTFLQMHCQALSFSLLRPTTWNLQLWDMTNNAKQRAVDLRVKAGWPWVSRWKQIALANAWACSMPLVLQMSNDTKKCRFRGCGCSHCRHVICGMTQIPVHKTIKTSKDIKRI